MIFKFDKKYLQIKQKVFKMWQTSRALPNEVDLGRMAGEIKGGDRRWTLSTIPQCDS